MPSPNRAHMHTSWPVARLGRYQELSTWTELYKCCGTVVAPIISQGKEGACYSACGLLQKLSHLAQMQLAEARGATSMKCLRILKNNNIMMLLARLIAY